MAAPRPDGKVDKCRGPVHPAPMMPLAIPFPDWLSPEIVSFEIGGFAFALRWYAMAYIVGILIGWWMATRAVKAARLWRDERPPLGPGEIEELLTWVILGVIAGGRLGFVLFYQPAYYLANPVEILFVWQGGMAFHGGLLGVMIVCLWFARRWKVPPLTLGDLLCLATPPGLFLGRVANFINAELWGNPTTLPWGVVFPGRMAQDCPGIEGLCARHPSQLYEALLEGLVLGAVLIWLVWRRGALKRPGLVAGTFFAGYGIARFLVEFVRQSDPQFITPDNPAGHVLQFAGTGLSMGQILTLPMILLGFALILWSRRAARPA